MLVSIAIPSIPSRLYEITPIELDTNSTQNTESESNRVSGVGPYFTKEMIGKMVAHRIFRFHNDFKACL